MEHSGHLLESGVSFSNTQRVKLIFNNVRPGTKSLTILIFSFPSLCYDYATVPLAVEVMEDIPRLAIGQLEASSKYERKQQRKIGRIPYWCVREENEEEVGMKSGVLDRDDELLLHQSVEHYPSSILDDNFQILSEVSMKLSESNPRSIPIFKTSMTVFRVQNLMTVFRVQTSMTVFRVQNSMTVFRVQTSMTVL
ncbi:hypothetical protein DAPPUDRAFT_106175 [Daphnia pulex]|uniref:Uncharacterized protein n=1 Tax=Daphnia pulex TaxID=6669 RepID=E9GTA4_DAPPU|nr:hypothetical protein DAPPUDRAFT_106175 [Daphnia pulex]|eukprot:EFX77395.1 hypothetical protein DAPPUDRAFT_106175 [Daphnia pulex]